MRQHTKIFFSIGIAVLLQAVAPSYAGHGIVLDTDGVLWNIDLTTGAYSNPRETYRPDCPSCSPFLYGGALELDSDGNLYGMNRNAVYSINPDDGEVLPIGTLGFQEYFPGGLAWDESTDTMFGAQITIGTGAVVRHLMEIDLDTGLASSVVGNLFLSSHIAGLSFDNSGNLFALWLFYLQTNEALLRLDKTNGQVLQSISLTGEPIYGTLAGMDFDSDTNTMYIAKRLGSFSSPASLYSINLTTGFVTLIGTYDEPIQATSLVIFPDVDGDFDDDGDVDGADFLKWQRDDGTAADLTIWASNYGTIASAASETAQNIPEPTSVALMLLFCLFLMSRRQLSHF